MEIYLIRHAQSIANKQNLMQGDLDYTLSDHGIRQAEELRELLPEFDKVYTSRLHRASQTADVISDSEPTYVAALSELNIGKISGKPYSNKMEDHDERISYFYLENDTYHEKVGGESVKEFIHRVSQAFAEIIDQTEENERIAIVTHGGTMRAILYKYLGILNSTEADFSNAEVIILKSTNGLFEFVERIKPKLEE